MELLSFETWLETPVVGRPESVNGQMSIVLDAIGLIRPSVVRMPPHTLGLRRLMEARGLDRGYLEALTNVEIYHYPYTQGIKA